LINFAGFKSGFRTQLRIRRNGIAIRNQKSITFNI